MQLATLLRDSDGSLVRRSVGGSEWTAAGWPSLAPVALLVVVCQQLPAVHYTARWKVGTRFAGCCYRLRCSSVHVLAEASGATLPLAGLASCCSLVVGGSPLRAVRICR